MLRLLEWVGGGGWEGSVRLETCFIKATKMVQFQVTIIKQALLPIETELKVTIEIN